MGKAKRQLSQAEIWDDSALLQSWEEALDEYKVRDRIGDPNLIIDTPNSFIIVYMRKENASKT